MHLLYLKCLSIYLGGTIWEGSNGFSWSLILGSVNENFRNILISMQQFWYVCSILFEYLENSPTEEEKIYIYCTWNVFHFSLQLLFKRIVACTNIHVKSELHLRCRQKCIQSLHTICLILTKTVGMKWQILVKFHNTKSHESPSFSVVVICGQTWWS
jgi:hypothetical protein